MRELSELSIVLKNTTVIRVNDRYAPSYFDKKKNKVVESHGLFYKTETGYKMELYQGYWNDSIDGQIDTFAHELFHGTKSNEQMRDDRPAYLERPHEKDAREKTKAFMGKYGELVKKHLRSLRKCLN